MNRPLFPILNYHGLESRPAQYAWQAVEKPYVVDRPSFLKHLDLLQKFGFSSLSCARISDWLAGHDEAARPVLLTFDDGHLSHYEEAAPCLTERKMGAVFFIPAGLVGRKDRMSWLQIRELAAEGFEIGSHGMMHVPLSGLPEASVFEELAGSKKRLEDKLGLPVAGLSIPRGFYQPRIRRMAQAVGYRWVFTSDFDINTPASDAMALKRMAVVKNTSELDFLRMIQGELGIRRMMEKAKTKLRSVVPPSLYDRLADTKRRVASCLERKPVPS